MMNITSKLLLILILFCGLQNRAIAQNSVEAYSRGVDYTNDEQVMEDFKKDAKMLIHAGIQLTPDKAGEQLENNAGKRISLNLTAPKKTPLTGHGVYKKILPSVVFIGKPYKRYGHLYVASASGYIIDSSGIIVTNYHVAEKYAQAVRDPLAMLIRTKEGKTYQVSKILTCSKENDLAILKLAMNGDKLNPVSLAKPAKVGDTVYVLSNPYGMVDFFSKGIVSRNVIHENLSGNKLKYEMSITADYGVGSSGGPIVNRYGNVVGTVASTYNIYSNPRAGKGLQMVVKSAIPVAALKTLIEY